MSYTRQQLEKWISKIEVKADFVYDIGGEQRSIKKRVKKWEVKKYSILDLPDYDLNCMPTEEWLGYIVKADIIFCIEVSEYLFDPVRALKNINNLLKKDGLLYMSFHFMYPIHKPKGTDYLRYTPDGVKKLLRESGFKIVEMVDRVSKIDLEQIYKAEGMHTIKEINNNIIGTLVKAKKL